MIKKNELLWLFFTV